MRFQLAVFLACLTGVVSYPLVAQQRVRIEVKTDWGRYVNSKWKVSKSRIVITGGSGIYRAADHPVPPQAVERFLAALAEPPLEKPSLESCGIDPAWLADSFHLSKEELRRRFAAEFDSLRLDNEHSLRATVNVDRKTVILGPGSDHPFMLPWTTLDGKRNYNCRISRALADLLPDGFLNKSQFSNDFLREAINSM